MGGLTPAQLESFKEWGFVIVPSLVPDAQADSWAAQFWHKLLVDPDAPLRWPLSAGHHEAEIYTQEAARALVYPFPGGRTLPVDPVPVRPRFIELPQVAAVVEQLLGAGKFVEGQGYCDGQAPDGFPEGPGNPETDTVGFRWPTGQPWERPDGGHIENYNGGDPSLKTGKGGWAGGFALGAITYWEDVGPHGGGTFIWPKSHTSLHRYFCEDPSRITHGRPGVPGSDAAKRSWSEAVLNEVCPGGYHEQGMEVVMKKGDVLFWHHWLVHQTSQNSAARPRQALFGRWCHANRRAMRHDIGGISTGKNMWKYWTAEVQQGTKGAVVARL